MEYQITLISHSTPNLNPAMKRIWDLPDPPAGSYSVTEVGSNCIITFYRDQGEDSGVLEAYGEDLNTSTAIRQMHREMVSVIGQMDAQDPDVYVALAITLAKEFLVSLNSECAVQGLDKAPDPHRIHTAVPVIGEDGSRYYAAMGTKGLLELVRADNLAQATARLQEYGGLDSPPDVDFYLLGHERPSEIR